MSGRFQVEICYTQPRRGRFCAAGSLVSGAVVPGDEVEVEGHVRRARAAVIAVEELSLRSTGPLQVLVFDLATVPWRPVQVDGRVLLGVDRTREGGEGPPRAR